MHIHISYTIYSISIAPAQGRNALAMRIGCTGFAGACRWFPATCACMELMIHVAPPPHFCYLDLLLIMCVRV